jgi:hypothetical protein
MPTLPPTLCRFDFSIRGAARSLACAGLALTAALPLALAQSGYGVAPAAEAPKIPAAAPAPQGAFGYLTQGKLSGAARYRYENYAQDSVPGATTAAAGRIDGNAVASTLRLTLGYETLPCHGLTAFVEGEGVYAVGEDEHYRIATVPGQSDQTRAVINDPLGTELNQAFLKWQVPDTGVMLLAGRESFFLNNGRFVSYSPWRQNNQSIDLARTSVKFGGGYTANYAYLNKVHRVVGADATDGDLGMNSHVGSFDYAKKGVFNASAYAVLLDYDDNAGQAANDTASTGLRVTGPYKLDETWSVVYTADYAHQTDYADNPANVALDYWCVELGVGYKAHKAYFGWTVLEGGAGNTFKTPLAHPFNGWTEKFAATPGSGLDARYLTVTGPVPGVKGLNYTAIAYDYYADSTSAHYGSELDAALEWAAVPIHKNLTLGWRFGQYYADELFTDSLRTSLYATFKL